MSGRGRADVVAAWRMTEKRERRRLECDDLRRAARHFVTSRILRCRQIYRFGPSARGRRRFRRGQIAAWSASQSLIVRA